MFIAHLFESRDLNKEPNMNRSQGGPDRAVSRTPRGGGQEACWEFRKREGVILYFLCLGTPGKASLRWGQLSWV